MAIDLLKVYGEQIKEDRVEQIIEEIKSEVERLSAGYVGAGTISNNHLANGESWTIDAEGGLNFFGTVTTNDASSIVLQAYRSPWEILDDGTFVTYDRNHEEVLRITAEGRIYARGEIVNARFA